MSLAILSARFDQKSGMSAMTAMVDGCAACVCWLWTTLMDGLSGWEVQCSQRYVEKAMVRDAMQEGLM